MNREARDKCRSHPDPVTMPHEDVVCWECGAARRTPEWSTGMARDTFGHAYCPAHRDRWGKEPPCVIVAEAVQ